MAEKPFSAADLDIRDVVISRSQMRESFTLFERLNAEAQRRGITLRIVSDEEYEQIMSHEEETTLGETAPAPVLSGVQRRSDGSGILWISRSDVRDTYRYEALLQEAQAKGLTVQIEPKST